MFKHHTLQRTRNLYDPGSPTPFRLSRSKLDLFLNCSRCFYFDLRLGIKRPAGFPFNLNIAVDTLLKKEFDIHRAAHTAHPLMKKYGIDAVPLAHENMDAWRDSLRRGVRYLHHQTNFLITGGVDDIWVNPREELIVVDYKATSKDGEVNLDADWQIGYKRQMEIYQWLLRRNDFKVSDTGYFVYCNGKTDRAAFDGKLEFEVVLIPYVGADNWIEKAITQAANCLKGDKIPKAAPDCEYCDYVRAASQK